MSELVEQCPVCGGLWWRPERKCRDCGAYVGSDGKLHEPKEPVKPPEPEPEPKLEPKPEPKPELKPPAEDDDRWP